MKKRPGKKPANQPPSFPRQPRPKKRWLVLLDQEPLRRQAASECNRAMARLERARAEWKRYEREDQPAFGRWMAATFGALLTRIREAEELVRQKEMLMREVEMEMAFGTARSERAAFAKVQQRHEQPPSPAEDFQPKGSPPPAGADGDNSDWDDGEPEEMSEFEMELFFEEMLISLGLDPDRMSDKQYARMFREFKERIQGPPPEERLPDREPLPAPPKSEQSRIKEIYRILVRRLHPDTQTEKNPEVSMLWHEVQEAYHSGNLDRLEMLLAFTDMQSNTAGEHTSLHQMRAVLAELRDAFNALQRSLRAAKKGPAWGFAWLGDRSKTEKRLRGELESDLAWHEDQLRQLEALFARWSAAPKRRGKPAGMMQTDFPF